jgi:hypothetical protein
MNTSPAASSVSTAKAERVDFLKQMVAFTEANNRAYDTKAQISFAPFVLSFNTIIAVANAVCGAVMARTILLVVVVLRVIVTVAYLWVLLPIRSTGVAADSQAQDLFYIRDAASLTATAFAQKLETLSTEAELIFGR